MQRLPGIKAIEVAGWVYNRFIDKIEYLSMRVNHEFLDSTNYILHPELFFNIVSNNLVSLNEQEKTEMRSEIARAICFDEPFRKRF